MSVCLGSWVPPRTKRLQRDFIKAMTIDLERQDVYCLFRASLRLGSMYQDHNKVDMFTVDGC